MSFDSKQGNNLFHVLRLPSDRKGFVIWKEQLELSIRAQGLYGHLDGTVTRPVEPVTTGVTVPTAEQASTIERYPRDISQYLQEQAMVFQQIVSMIPNTLYLKIKGKVTVKEAWDALKVDFEKRSCMITIELRKHLQDTRCAENGNI